MQHLKALIGHLIVCVHKHLPDNVEIVDWEAMMLLSWWMQTLPVLSDCLPGVSAIFQKPLSHELLEKYENDEAGVKANLWQAFYPTQIIKFTLFVWFIFWVFFLILSIKILNRESGKVTSLTFIYIQSVIICCKYYLSFRYYRCFSLYYNFITSAYNYKLLGDSCCSWRAKNAINMFSNRFFEKFSPFLQLQHLLLCEKAYHQYETIFPF